MNIDKQKVSPDHLLLKPFKEFLIKGIIGCISSLELRF